MRTYICLHCDHEEESSERLNDHPITIWGPEGELRMEDDCGPMVEMYHQDGTRVDLPESHASQMRRYIGGK